MELQETTANASRRAGGVCGKLHQHHDERCDVRIRSAPGRHELESSNVLGYERVLRDDEMTFAVMRYIIENPLRAKLTDDIMLYPFWGSEVYSREQMIEYVQQCDVWAG